MKSDKFEKGRHNVYSLFFHLILCVKYRQKVFTNDEIINRLKEINENIAKKYDVEIVEQECGVDYIHLLLKTKPSINFITFINMLKGVSSRYLRKEFSKQMSKKLLGEHFWSPSYFLATTGNISIEVLKKYIEGQRDK